jgi:hypothetical protein
MKRNQLTITLVLILFLLIQSFKNSESITDYYKPDQHHSKIILRSTGVAANGLGDRTGSPISSGSTCAQCHGGAAFSPAIALTITDNGGGTVTNYTPGEEYNLSFTITNTNGTPVGYGMQATALQSGNTAAGTFSTPSANAQISSFSSRSYFEHITMSTSPTFTSKWTAPATNSGAVTFYFTGNAVNGNGSTSGDAPSPAASLVLNETLSTTDFDFQNNIKLVQNPMKEALKINFTESYLNIDLQLFDVFGKLVFTKKYENTNTINEEISLKTGIYFVKLKNEDNLKATFKLIKE